MRAEHRKDVWLAEWRNDEKCGNVERGRQERRLEVVLSLVHNGFKGRLWNHLPQYQLPAAKLGSYSCSFLSLPGLQPSLASHPSQAHPFPLQSWWFPNLYLSDILTLSHTNYVLSRCRFWGVFHRCFLWSFQLNMFKIICIYNLPSPR